MKKQTGPRNKGGPLITFQSDKKERQEALSEKAQAVQLLSYIFDDVLPGHGMTKRNNQK